MGCGAEHGAEPEEQREGRVKVSDIEVHGPGFSRPYRSLGIITAKASKASLFSKSPTIEDVNYKLQEEALKVGANAIVDVSYERGMTLFSYEVLTAKGQAAIVESDEVPCPVCAETIKRAAKKCKHCGAEV